MCIGLNISYIYFFLERIVENSNLNNIWCLLNIGNIIIDSK